MYLLSVKSNHKFFSETVCLNSIFLKSLIKKDLETIVDSENSMLKNLYGTELFILKEKHKSEFNLRGGFEKKILFITNGEGVPFFIPEVETKYAVVFGNEVNGVSQSAVDACDYCLEIPQFGTKHSFNISVTVGIVLYDLSKKIKL